MIGAALMFAAAAGATQFDLLCTVTSLSLRLGDSLPEELHRERIAVQHVRVDIGAGAWCEDECLYVSPASSNESSIILNHQEVSGIQWFDQINRRTGTRVNILATEYGGLERKIATMSACEAKPFSGFPARKF